MHLQFICICDINAFMVVKDDRQKAVKSLLQEAGLKSTVARRAILSVMLGAGPMRKEEIASRVGDNAPDAATLYRTLRTLEDTGLVKRHRFRGPEWYFSLHIPGSSECNHAHFVCENCGSCECLTKVVPPSLPSSVKKRNIKNIEFVISGLCSDCRR